MSLVEDRDIYTLFLMLRISICEQLIKAAAIHHASHEFTPHSAQQDVKVAQLTLLSACS